MKFTKLLATHILLCCFLSVIGQNTWQDSIPTLMHQLAVSKNDTNKVLVLLKISHAYIFKEGENADDLNAAIKFSGEAKRLSEQYKFQKGIGQSQINLSAAYREKGDKTTAKVYIENAIKIFEGSSYTEELIATWCEKSYFFDLDASDEKPQKVFCLKQVVKYCGQTNDKERYAGELINLGEALYDSTSVGLFNEALITYQRIGYKPLQRLYEAIGTYYCINQLNNLALRYCMLALNTAKSLHDSSMELCTIYNVLGITNFRINKFKDAQRFFEEGLKIATFHQDNKAKSFLAENIVDALWKQQKSQLIIHFLDSVSAAGYFDSLEYSICSRKEAQYIRAFTELGDYRQAATHLKPLDEFNKKLGNYGRNNGLAYDVILKYYLAIKDLAKVKNILTDYKNYINQQGVLDNQIAYNLAYYKLDSLQGNYLEAVKHLQTYQFFVDSLSKVTQNRLIAEVQEEFKSNEKENEIRNQGNKIMSLNQQAQLQQNNIAQTQKIRNIIIIAAVILLMMLLLLFNKYKANRRYSEALSAKQDEINVKNKSLESSIIIQTKLLEEKSWLVKEIHHRVKNNLHTIMSLLETQSVYLQDDALLAIKDSKHRVHAMSLIHQKLYNLDNASRVEIISYIKELVAYLKDGLHVKNNIIFFIKGEPVELDISHAAPLGIILNEAITNTMKYAFPDGRDGIVNIEIKALGKNRLQLVIEDNGIGLPLKFNIEKVNSLGMKLIRGLSEDFDAEFEIQSIGGTRICLTFQTDPFLH